MVHLGSAIPAHLTALPPNPNQPLQAVQLALQCLSFDFVGTCLDESSEDLGTIQVPSGAAASIMACNAALQCCHVCCMPV